MKVFPIIVINYGSPKGGNIPRRMSKKEYAKRADIPERTLRYYLNDLYFPILEKYGYSKKQRMLSAFLVITIDIILAVSPD